MACSVDDCATCNQNIVFLSLDRVNNHQTYVAFHVKIKIVSHFCHRDCSTWKEREGRRFQF